jgi:hypothetical protein
MRKGILDKLLLLLLLSPAVMHAQMINEIMYDVPGTDTGREWIEFFNSSANTFDLTGWKFLENDTISHLALSAFQGSLIISPGAYAVIVSDTTKFLADWPGYTGTILKGSFSLSNASSTLHLKSPSGTLIDQAYASNSESDGTGNALSRQSDGSWVAATPTPGAVNVAPVIQSQNNSDTATTTDTTTDTNIPVVTPIYSSHYSFVPVSDTPAQKLSASVGRNRLGFVGVPLAFKAITDTNDTNASYFWSFGDGGDTQGKEVTHTYLYPGTYTLVLNVKLFEYEAVSRATIKIVVPQVVVSSASPDFIELKNNSEYEMNLYGFRLREGTKIFEFPMDTIVGPKAEVILPKAITKFGPTALSSIKFEAKSLPILAAALSEPAPLLAIESTPVSNEHAEEIQALADKLVSLNMELFAMNNPDYPLKGSLESTPTIEPEITKTAAAAEAVASSSWKITLRHFFSR